MQLADMIGILEELGDQCESWSVAVLTRDGEEPDGEIVEHPIFEIEIDDEDDVIELRTDEEAEAPRSREEGLKVGQLLQLLRDLGPEYADYYMFSASAVVSIARVAEYMGRFGPVTDLPDGDKHQGQIVLPLLAWARNNDDKSVGFLRWPAEQWGLVEDEED